MNQIDPEPVKPEVDYLQRARTIADRVDLKSRPGAEKAHTDALVAQMRSDGLVAAAVPQAFGGPGLSVGDLARVTFHIARASGSAGLIYAMHMSQALSVVQHGKGAFFEDFQRRMVRDQILIASGTSEKGPGGDILHSLCNIQATEQGMLRVTKESPNISYVDLAGAILVSANLFDAKGKSKQVLVLAESSGTLYTPGRDTSFIGMRGILNRPYSFTCEFSSQAVFGQNFSVIARGTMTPSIHIFWAALWSGLAWQVLERAKRFVSQEIAPDNEAHAIVRHDLTRLCNRHFTMNALIRDAITAFDTPDSSGAMGFAATAGSNRLKICCSELLEEICQGALKIIGIRGYATGGPYTLAEPLADALSASIMVSNTRLAINTSKLESFVDEAL